MHLCGVRYCGCRGLAQKHNTVTPPSDEPGPLQQSQVKNNFTKSKIIIVRVFTGTLREINHL